MAEEYNEEARRRRAIRTTAGLALAVTAIVSSLWPHRHEIIDKAFRAREAFYERVFGKPDPTVSEDSPARRIVPGAGVVICRSFVAVVPLEDSLNLVITDPAITSEGEVFSKIGGNALTSPVPVDAWINLKTAARVELPQVDCRSTEHRGVDVSSRPVSSDTLQPACPGSPNSLNWRQQGGYSDIRVVSDVTGEDLIVDLTRQQAAYTTPCEQKRSLI